MTETNSTRLILVRHGHSVANEKNIFAGQQDYKLTEIGIKQADLMAEYVLRKYRIDAVYSSDLSRAVDTAKSIAEYNNLPIIQDKRLREQCGGIWENLSFCEISEKYPKEFEIWNADFSKIQPPRGETVQDVQKRAMEAIFDIAKREQGKTVFIATHRVLLRTVQCVWEQVPIERIEECAWLSNCSVSEVLFKNGKLIPVNVGQDDFLGDMAVQAYGMM